MSIPKFDITGQKVLIVGGGRGIGKGIALAFAEAGADVAVSALTPTGVSKVAEEVQAMGRKALALTGDATKAADMDRVAQQVRPRRLSWPQGMPGLTPAASSKHSGLFRVE
jgi:7-alpha-hydroxysteroid dehydrogenase